MELTDLPNIDPVLADNLRKIGVDTPEELRAMGAEEAWLRIRAQVDESACLHQLQALAGAAEGVAEESRRRVLREILYHLGRWIYLVDAADDLKKDFENGSYNPLIYRYELTEGKLPEDIQAQFATTLDHSIRLMGAACALWDFGCWSALIESTLDRGLFYVGGAVLNGSFRKKRKKETP